MSDSYFNCKCCGSKQSREAVGTYVVLNPSCLECGEPTEGDNYVDDLPKEKPIERRKPSPFEHIDIQLKIIVDSMALVWYAIGEQ